ncbi:GNAT family N-acetyltransferase [Candidatus Gracilibacteria bacterium]|nr:GNAT family N-acetyltransferase [Candidatus Gracilibacteria bacterium]
MEIKRYEDLYFDSFLECFLLFGKNRGHNINDNKNLIIENVKNKLLSNNYLYLGLIDGIVVGFLWAEVIEQNNLFSKNIKKILISYLYVIEKEVGKGYSTKLKDALFNDVKLEGKIKKISLNVKIENKTAFNIYKKWGFKEKKYYMDLDL